MDNQSVVTKTLSWVAIFRGITLALASCGFIRFLAARLFGENWAAGLSFYVVGTFALVALSAQQYTLPTIGAAGAEKSNQRRMPWALMALGVITGVGFNWACIFVALSRRYGFFSPPVMGATGSIMALYAVVAFLVGRLTGGNWRMALLVFAVAPCALGAIVFRLILVR